MKRYVAGLLCWKTNKRCVSSFFACWKSYGAGPTQRHMVLTRSTGCLQQASGKFISRKNEKLLDKQQKRAVIPEYALEIKHALTDMTVTSLVHA